MFTNMLSTLGKARCNIEYGIEVFSRISILLCFITLIPDNQSLDIAHCVKPGNYRQKILADTRNRFQLTQTALLITGVYNDSGHRT